MILRRMLEPFVMRLLKRIRIKMIVFRRELDRRLSDHKDEVKKLINNSASNDYIDSRINKLSDINMKFDVKNIDMNDRFLDLQTKMQYMSTIIDKLQEDNLRMTRSIEKHDLRHQVQDSTKVMLNDVIDTPKKKEDKNSNK